MKGVIYKRISQNLLQPTTILICLIRRFSSTCISLLSNLLICISDTECKLTTSSMLKHQLIISDKKNKYVKKPFSLKKNVQKRQLESSQ